MGRHFLSVLAVTLGIAVPAAAQTAITVNASPPGQRATREDVVARLTSFDLNHDGRVTRAELPERLHGLLTRGDADNDQALDAIETLRLAERPVKTSTVRGLQPGQYGFGDTSFQDSRLHIEGAIDDLRLAERDREKALDIARRFDTARQERTRNELLDTMAQILTAASLEDFKAALDRPAPNNLRVFTQALPAGANGEAAAIAQRVQVMARLVVPGNLARGIDKYGLQPAEQQRARAAIERYTEARNGRLGDTDRAALLDQLNTLLDDEQLDDLRAALERRPIVKQNAGFFGQNEVIFPAQGQVRIQNLVIKD